MTLNEQEVKDDVVEVVNETEETVVEETATLGDQVKQSAESIAKGASESVKNIAEEIKKIDTDALQQQTKSYVNFLVENIKNPTAHKPLTKDTQLFSAITLAATLFLAAFVFVPVVAMLHSLKSFSATGFAGLLAPSQYTENAFVTFFRTLVIVAVVFLAIPAVLVLLKKFVLKETESTSTTFFSFTNSLSLLLPLHLLLLVVSLTPLTTVMTALLLFEFTVVTVLFASNLAKLHVKGVHSLYVTSGAFTLTLAVISLVVNLLV